MTMAMDDRHTGADHKAGSFKDKLNARKGQPVDETAAAPPPAVPAETPAEPQTEKEAATAPVSEKIIEDGGFMIFRNAAETDTEAAAEPTADITPDSTPTITPDITADTAAAEPVEPAPEAQAAPASAPDADSLEASLAKAIDALEPAEVASSETDDNLDAAIDAIIATPAETDYAAAEAAAFNPGSFGAIGESLITADDFTADATPEDITPDITLGDHGDDITAASTMPPADHDTDDQAMMIGATMAHAIKSIVHDEMAQSIDRIAREAVRDALRQA